MATNLVTTESKFLERARVALTNAVSDEEIRTALADYGMDEVKIAEGRQVYENTKSIWQQNQREEAESKIASSTYKDHYEEMRSTFKRHRDITLIFFKKNPEVLVKLGVKGRFPSRYTEFFDAVNLFYSTIKADQAIQQQMDRIKLTASVVDDCIARYENLLADRANYEKELGESQDTTKSKDAALLALKEWMEDFDAVAKVALYDKPQLLEALGIFVRS